MSDIMHDPSTPLTPTPLPRGERGRGEGADNPEVRNEYSDVNLRGILVTAAALLAVTVVIYLVCWWMFDLFWSREAAAKRSQFPLAAAERGKHPRQPQLEGIKNTEGQPAYMRPRQLPAEEQERLNKTGWVDEKQGIVHIPIDQAMRVIVKKGLLRSRAEGAPGGQER